MVQGSDSKEKLPANFDPCFDEKLTQHIDLSVQQTLDDCLHTLTSPEDLFNYDIVKEVCLSPKHGVVVVLT